MFNGFHSLLPVRSQLMLMDAAKKDLNATIKQVAIDCPHSYHTNDTLDKRVFFDQPRGPIGNAKWINKTPPWAA